MVLDQETFYADVAEANEKVRLKNLPVDPFVLSCSLAVHILTLVDRHQGRLRTLILTSGGMVTVAYSELQRVRRFMEGSRGVDS